MSKINFEITRTLALLLVGFALLADLSYGQVKKARVLVDSYADKGYLENKETDDGLLSETYHFVEGKFVGGYIRDKSLREVPFMEIAENLAVELKKRNYYPARSKEEGDLLIVVNRGVTQIQAGFEELFPTDDEEDGPDSEGDEEYTDETPGAHLDESGYTYREQDNAKLIGFDRALRRRDLGIQESIELQEMLKEERYFLILSAFDLKTLRKTGEKRLVWSTRFSMDAVKVGFDDAHFALSRAASGYFGTNLDGDLGKVNTFAGPGEVTKGELRVVETLEE
jgi:hypothetical protein